MRRRFLSLAKCTTAPYTCSDLRTSRATIISTTKGVWQRPARNRSSIATPHHTLLKPRPLFAHPAYLPRPTGTVGSPRCLELLRDAREWGTEPNEVSYNTAISACAWSYRPAEALRLLREMPEHGLTPDVRSYGAAMRACAGGSVAGAGRASVVLGLLREMEEEAGLRPTAQHYKYALYACSNDESPRASHGYSRDGGRGDGGGAWEAAVALLRNMASEGVAADNCCYGRAMLACKRAGQWEAALVREECNDVPLVYHSLLALTFSQPNLPR